MKLLVISLILSIAISTPVVADEKTRMEKREVLFACVVLERARLEFLGERKATRRLISRSCRAEEDSYEQELITKAQEIYGQNRREADNSASRTINMIYNEAFGLW